MALIFFFAWLCSIFATNTALTTSSLNRQKQASISSKKSFVQIHGKKVSNDNGAEENVKKGKNRKRWAVYDPPQDGSRPDITQIAKLYKGLSIPDSVRADLSITEEALLIDISTFESTYPEEILPVEFQMRAERIKKGGELMGNDQEKKVHANFLFKANIVHNVNSNQKQGRRIYLDTVSSSHVCTTAVSDLQEIFIKDLTKDSINHGKILWVHIEEPCYRFHSLSAITVLVKDSEGTLLSLALHNILPPSATTKDAEKYFPVGTKIGIKEPFYKCFLSGYLGLRVDNPCNLEIDGSNLIQPDFEALSFDPFQQDSVENYYGPLEICDAGSKGRGVFLTKDVKEGEILLIEKAFGFQFNEENMETAVINMKLRTFSEGSHIALVNELVIATRDSTVNNMLSLLYSGVSNTCPMPSIDLFKTHNFSSTPQLSASTIEGIIYNNAFEMLHSSNKGTGLWVVASFCNHDTYTNTVDELSGKVKTMRAKKDLKAGTEITISYGTDSKKLKKWGI
jgi:hypothetical protein